MEFSKMEFWKRLSFSGPIYVSMFPVVVSILFFNHVATVNCEATTEIFYDCEKYCHMDCAYIPDTDPYHKEQCHAVHSHHSDCSCHFGGVAMGIFIFLGLFAIIILMACMIRYCRRRRTVTNTRIVVVAQPVAQDGIQNNNYQYQPTQQNVYSIPMETKRSNYYQNRSSDQEDETTITVITSRVGGQIIDSEPTSPNAPSRRIYFGNSSSNSNGRIRGGDSNEDQIFAPPTF